MNIDSGKLIENSFEKIRGKLLDFPGGRISLVKNDNNGIALITLDNPDKRNAMSGKMMVELRDCVETLEKWKEGKGVILCGRGGNFCSGGDLNFAKSNGSAQGGFDMSTWMQDTLIRLHKLPLVSVGLIQGPTLGGGAEISVFCDFLIAADDVKFGFVHGKMGIIPAWGGTTRLVQKVGQKTALELLITSKILNANDCVNVGLADAVVPSKEALTKTTEWLSCRLQHHHTVLQAMKEVVTNSSYHNGNEAFQLEKYRFAPFWGGEINKTALENNLKHVKTLKK